MNVQTKILEYLTANPNKSAEQITTAIGGKPNTVKVILHKMQARNQLIREHMAREVKTKQGPQKIYVYRMPAI